MNLVFLLLLTLGLSLAVNGQDSYEDDEEEEEGGLDTTESVLIAPPRFNDEDETEVTVDLGNTARLRCSVDNLGLNLISWVKSEEIISMGDQLFDKERERTSVESSEGASP